MVLGVVLVIVAFAVTVLIQTVLITPFTVPSSSMQNTLHIGDRIVVDKLAYGSSPVQRGDVVVFTDPGGWLQASQKTGGGEGDYLVKRVVGIPGDHVSCCSTNGRITVNGREVYEHYAVEPAGRPASASEFDVTVPAGSLWVLGDNRYNSRDSSQTQELGSKGFVPIANIVGQAVFKLWPLTQLAPIGSARETFATIPDATCPI
ncbi:signal peptidase I [Leifsonia xyli]|uniref:signal peptidase I n=1 Tax=Leifsonia xyli TaxID=1575 RepID=UPI003D666AEF